jgi:hypothetical protein
MTLEAACLSLRRLEVVYRRLGSALIVLYH